MRRLPALLALLVLTAGPCPADAMSALAAHGCCRAAEASCSSVGREMTCCAPAPVETPHATPVAPAAAKVPPPDSAPLVFDASASPVHTQTMASQCPTHGRPSVAPLLQTCLWRI